MAKLSSNDKKELKKYAKKTTQAASGVLVGAGKSAQDKQKNFLTIKKILSDLGASNTKDHVPLAAAELRSAWKCGVIETQAVDKAIDAAALKLVIDNESSDVTATIGGIDVRLDNDQLKHQPPGTPIGTRITAGGNCFKTTCDGTWHTGLTLVHMSNWAAKEVGMVEGEKRYHGQLKPVDNIHYEGFVQLLNGTKYVLFHCYPGDKSKFLL